MCYAHGQFGSEKVLHSMNIIVFEGRRLWMVDLQLRNDLVIYVAPGWRDVSCRSFWQPVANLFFTLWIQKRRSSSFSDYFSGFGFSDLLFASSYKRGRNSKELSNLCVPSVGDKMTARISKGNRHIEGITQMVVITSS
jgi:hypothetical protein